MRVLVRDERAKSNPDETDADFLMRTQNDAEFLLRTQMKQVAMADDGYEYDFDRIKAYIRQHVSRELRSPTTGQPMTAHVYFTVPVKDRAGEIIYTGKGVNRTPKMNVRAWLPTLNPPKRPA